jgi:hypothetical protein
MVDHYENPYCLKAAKSLNEFAGRNSELENIYLHFSDSCHSLIKAPRCYGKTSFLNIVKEIGDSKGFIFVDAYPSEEEKENLDKFLIRIFSKIKDEINRKSNDDKRVKDFNAQCHFDKDQIAYSFKSIFKEAKKLISEETRIILSFDDFDQLNRKEFLSRIDEIFSNLEGYILVLTTANGIGSELRLVDMISAIELKRFTCNEIKECIKKPLRQGQIDERTALMDALILYEMTKGHPYLVKLFAHYMYRNYWKNRNEIKSLSVLQYIDPDTIDEIYNDFESRKCENVDPTKRQNNKDLLKFIKTFETNGCFGLGGLPR